MLYLSERFSHSVFYSEGLKLIGDSIISPGICSGLKIISLTYIIIVQLWNFVG